MSKSFLQIRLVFSILKEQNQLEYSSTLETTIASPASVRAAQFPNTTKITEPKHQIMVKLQWITIWIIWKLDGEQNLQRNTNNQENHLLSTTKITLKNSQARYRRRGKNKAISSLTGALRHSLALPPKQGMGGALL